MFVQLPGYEWIETLYQGSHTIVYRAQQKKSKQPVVIKALYQEYPSFSELVQFRNQYTITKNLQLVGIVRTLSLEPVSNSYALVMEDVGSISLREYAQQQSLSLTEIL
ncbi:MAG: histidine kinase, partial [Alkalinema sp. CACIAM 70d]